MKKGIDTPCWNQHEVHDYYSTNSFATVELLLRRSVHCSSILIIKL